VLYGNTFDRTATFFDASVLFIRTQSNITIASYEPTNDYIPCLGLLIDNNTFTYNFGCPKYGGQLIGLQCVSNLDTTSQFNSTTEYDVDNVELDSAASLSPDQLIYYLYYENWWVSDDVLETFKTPSGLTVQVPKYKNIFRSNQFLKNFGGYGKGLIDIFGMFRLHMTD
jgi:protein tyrosine phosphatase